METILVYETANSFKADMVEALFKSNAIPYERRTFGAGPHIVRLLGTSTTSGIEIFVPADYKERATELLQSTGF